MLYSNKAKRSRRQPAGGSRQTDRRMDKVRSFIKENRELLLFFAVSRLFFAVMMLLSRHSYPEILGLFDTEHYRNIASYGYYHESISAFFPMIPLLIKLTGDIGLLVINEFAFLLTLFLTKDLLMKDYKVPAASVNMTLAIISLSPAAFFSMLEYTESIFLYLTLSAFVLFKRNLHPVLMGVLIGLSVFTRNVGALLFFCIFAGMCLRWARKEIRFTRIVASYVPATLISLIFPVYLHFKLGNWSVFLSSQYDYWLKIHSNIAKTVYWNLRYIFTDNFPYDAQDTKILFKTNEALTFIIFCFVLFIAGREIYYAVRKKRLDADSLVLVSYALLCVISFSSTIRDPLIDCPTDSFYRYYLSMFPIFILPAKRPLPQAPRLGIFAFTALMSMVTSLFFSMGVFFF